LPVPDLPRSAPVLDQSLSAPVLDPLNATLDRLIGEVPVIVRDGVFLLSGEDGVGEAIMTDEERQKKGHKKRSASDRAASKKKG